MTVEQSIVGVPGERRFSYVQWGPAISGAFAAAALAFVLQSFGAAVGLAISSTSPTWRDSSASLEVLSGLYLVLVAIAAFGLGGYLAGRLSAPRQAAVDETEFQDGLLGILVWAIAIILTVFMTWAATASLGRLTSSGSSSGQSQLTTGETLIAYDLDRLFRAERRSNADLTYARAEAARILLTSAGHTGVAPEDRAYLVRLTATHTGLSAADAEARVNTIIPQARSSIRKARQAAVILAFMAGAAALVGAAVAWVTATVGGEHRDGRSAPPAWWGLRGRRI
jgi:hypothetical protein